MSDIYRRIRPNNGLRYQIRLGSAAQRPPTGLDVRAGLTGQGSLFGDESRYLGHPRRSVWCIEPLENFVPFFGVGPFLRPSKGVVSVGLGFGFGLGLFELGSGGLPRGDLLNNAAVELLH